MANITDRQKKFADEYLVDLNATRAYKEVYKDCKKDETVRANASRLLTNANVKKYIAVRQEEIQEKTHITQEMIIKELASVAFSNGTDFSKVIEKSCIDAQGNEHKYKSVDVSLTDNVATDKLKAISSIRETKYGIEIKTNDKIKALELLGKHLGLFDVKQDEPITEPSKLFDALETEDE